MPHGTAMSQLIQQQLYWLDDAHHSLSAVRLQSS